MTPNHFLCPQFSGNHCRYPEVLRTDRQIYSEAASVLYSELTIIVELGDIVCMRKKRLEGMEKAKKKVWRHNPLHGNRNEHGRHIYNTPPIHRTSVCYRWALEELNDIGKVETAFLRTLDDVVLHTGLGRARVTISAASCLKAAPVKFKPHPLWAARFYSYLECAYPWLH